MALKITPHTVEVVTDGLHVLRPDRHFSACGEGTEGPSVHFRISEEPDVVVVMSFTRESWPAAIFGPLCDPHRSGW